MKSAELLVRCLENEKVKFAYGIPGEENLDLMDALHDSTIRFVTTRHEEAAAFMADVYGRFTGHAGVCLSTLGPGATNLVTGVADAYLDRAPLVALTAQEALGNIHRESHQYINVLELFSPITKWNARIENAASIPEITRKAFKTAQTEKPGSTHIELPIDSAEQETDGKPLTWEVTRRPSPDRKSLQKAVELIAAAHSPMILAGNGVIRGGASLELTEFAEELHIPVAHTLMGKGAIPWSSPMSLLTMGLQVHDYERVGFNTTDLVICVGYDFVEYDPKFWNRRGEKRIIHIDFTPAEISSHYTTDVEIVADIRESIELIREASHAPKDAERVSALRVQILNRLDSWSDESKGSLKPPVILKVLRECMAKDDILVSDVGAHKIWLGRFFEAYKPKTMFISNGFASMGIALPGGIAIKLAQPDRRVLTLSGDGGFLMMVHELETAKREMAATVNLVLRDGGFGSIRWKQLNKFGRTTGTEFTNPDLLGLAKSFGIRGFQVTNAKELPSILEEALGLNEPSLVDVPVDYTDNPFLEQDMGAVLSRS
ncbi:MAG TPA: acetolactate synthase large subunit [Candidatus Acidoferrales bacterium]|nr:acetolactate synthase large subunit [Candidatus Acidoferrales bacterium]